MWLRDIQASKTAEKNTAELQTITVERLAEVWRYEAFITLRQRRAAHKYFGLWTHARGNRTYSLADLAAFPRAARRDDDLVAACGFLIDFIDEKARRWLWREAREGMGWHANCVDDVVLFGRVGDVDGLRAGLNRLVWHFAQMRRQWVYELELFGESVDVARTASGDSRDAGVPRRLGEDARAPAEVAPAYRRHAA